MIIRRKHKSRFAIIPNAIWEDKRLSIEAKGVLGYLLSRPHDWTVRHGQLMATLLIGRKWLDRIIGELIAAGYIQRDHEQGRDEHNKFTTYNYVVTDESDDVASQVSVVRTAHRRKPLRGRDTGTKKERNKTENTNLPLPLIEPVASLAGSAMKEARSRNRAPRPDRGTIEVQIVERIGPDGFDVLMELPPSEVEALCARQRRGTLDDLAIMELRGRELSPRSKPPAADDDSILEISTFLRRPATGDQVAGPSEEMDGRG